MKTELQSKILRTLSKSDIDLSGRLLVKQVTYIVDSAVLSLFRSIEIAQNIKDRLCLIAIGGYGRMELAPYSDIDLLYLHDGVEESIMQEIISKVNNFLYDSGMDVGHSCRTIEESKQYIENIQTFHSILDSRFLVGSRKIYERYKTEFLQCLPEDLLQEFNRIKLMSLEDRILKSHNPLLLTEPNIKSDPLGLRDIQYMYWIEKTHDATQDKLRNGVIDFFTKGETLPIILAYDFFLKIRINLHILAKKKNDRLELGMQPDIAVAMGFGERGLNSVESFMSSFYKHQKDLIQFIGIYLDNKINIPRRSEFEEIEYLGLPLARTGHYLYPSTISKLFTQPENLYKDVVAVFLAAQDRDLDISPTLMDQLRFAANFLDDDFKNNRIAIELFLQLIRENRSVGKYLSYMHHSNILGKLLPEFGACTNFPLFSYHHEYPVDEHSLLILRELDVLVRGLFPDEEVQNVFKSCQNIDILYLAILTHDAGKVKEGDHCQYGSELAGAISRRLNLSEEDESLFRFLVAHHIDMSEISSKRDIFDPNLIQEFAEIVVTKERLSLLYVMTVIDTKSVGPNTLTNWKKEILYKFYKSTLIYLESNTTNIEKKENYLQQFKNYLVSKEEFSEEISHAIANFANQVIPNSYLHSNTYRRILFHFTQFQILKKQNIDLKIDFEKEPSYLTLTIYSKFRNDILLHVSGSVTSLNLNLVGMQTYRYQDSQDDFLITQVHLTDSLGSGNINDNTIDILESQLDDTLNGILSLDDVTSTRSIWNTKTVVPNEIVDEMVSFSNSENDEFTVLEIRFPDSIGLIYRILKLLNEKGIEVLFARITTSADFAYDSFYIKNRHGKKLEDQKEMEDLRDEIMMASRENFIKSNDFSNVEKIYF